MEGNNSEDVKQILNNPKLRPIFMDFAEAKDEEKDLFQFIKDAKGRINIIDHRPEIKKLQTAKAR